MLRGKFRIDGRNNVETTNGFPIIVYLTKDKKEKIIRTGYFTKKTHWDVKNALPTNKHPQYVDLLNYLEQKKIVLSKLLASSKVEHITLKEAEKILTQRDSDIFFKEGLKLKQKGRTYKIVLNSFQKYFPDYTFDSITPKVAKDYMNILLTTPVINDKSIRPRSPNGVISYMNSLTAVWNKLEKPNNPFSKIRPKPIQTKSKSLAIEDLIIIRDANAKNHSNARGGGVANYFNYLMLCFYLGGIDLGELVKFRYDKHVINGRIEFNRTKGGSSVFVSNYIFPEAWEILDQYDAKPYLIPLAINNKYKNFLPNISKALLAIQKKYKLSKKPYSKSPRYTFITRAQHLLIDERITIEIVGHSQHSIHSIYKDEFPLHVRDEAHKKIITLE